MFESVLSIRMLRRLSAAMTTSAPHYLAIQIVHQNKSAASKRVTMNVSLIETVPLVIAVRTDFASQTHLLRQPS